jgi:hypothetical protein
MEWISYLLTVLGLVLLVVLWRRGPIDMEEPAPAMTEAVAGGGDIVADWSPPTGQPLPESAGDATPPAGIERPAIEEAVEPGSDEAGIERAPSQVGEARDDGAADDDGTAADDDGTAADDDGASDDDRTAAAEAGAADGDGAPDEDVDDTQPEELPAVEGASPKEGEEPPAPSPPPSGSLG